MGKLFLLVCICSGIGFCLSPAVGALLFFGALIGIGLVAIFK